MVLVLQPDSLELTSHSHLAFVTLPLPTGRLPAGLRLSLMSHPSPGPLDSLAHLEVHAQVPQIRPLTDIVHSKDSLAY